MSVNLAVTGYYGTGSSAAIDYLSDIDGVALCPDIDEYEHNIFYQQGGLYELGAILMHANSPYNSDAAISQFVDAVKRENDNNFGAFGSYKFLFGDEFADISSDFLKAISRSSSWRSQPKCVRFSLVKAILQIGAYIVWRRPIAKLGRKYVYDRNKFYFAMPSSEEFRDAARKYTSAYFDMCARHRNPEVRLFDHVIWPQQYKLIDDYFDESFRLIVVKRDPRDVYLLNKYFWHVPPLNFVPPYYPTDVKLFVETWKSVIVPPSDSINQSQVLFIDFEDLVYRYDHMQSKMAEFLGIDTLARKEGAPVLFDPKQSIENTQIFNANPEWLSEVSLIERELPEYLYDFPYKYIPDKSKWFDSRGVTPVKK